MREGNRPRWGGRSSKSVGAASLSRVGSTPTPLRHRPWTLAQGISEKVDGGRILAALDGLTAGFNTHDIDRIMGFFADDCSPGRQR